MPPSLWPMSALVPTHPITLQEYWALDLAGDDGAPLCTELVAGMVVVSPPPGGPHQVATGELTAALLAGCPVGFRVIPGAGWVVTDAPQATLRIPDVMVVTDAQARLVRMTEPPLLAVEVVSRATSVERDLVTKRREYAEAGCVHYWVVLPDRPELIRFRLDDRVYVEAGRTTGRRRVRVTAPYVVTVDLARLVV